MKGELKQPTTLMEAIVFFSDEQRAFDTMIARRWPEGVSCPVCKSNAVRFMSARRFWNCNGCRKQFSIKTGTIFEASPISLGKWLTAAWLIANAKNGISSCELARSIGVTQKSAWFMNHRIRLAMANGSIEKLSGEVEVDETYFGGKKIPGKPGRGASGKIPVVGAVERGGRVVTILSRNVSQKELTPFVQANVEPTAKVFTDDWSGYRKLPSAGFNHSTINHTLGFYTDGDIHTQNIESFWSLIKRTLKGTYVSVEPIHLHRYLGEYGFRFNERKANDGQRFVTVASQVTGKRLTYKQLTGKELAAGA